MKSVTLNIPDNMRIGEAISKALYAELQRRDGKESIIEMHFLLKDIEDQDLLSLLGKLK